MARVTVEEVHVCKSEQKREEKKGRRRTLTRNRVRQSHPGVSRHMRSRGISLASGMGRSGRSGIRGVGKGGGKGGTRHA